MWLPTRLPLALALALALALEIRGGAAFAEPPPPAAKLSDLGWLAGSWAGAAGAARTEEHWLRPQGAMMLGLGRTFRDGRTLSFEFLRIEERPDGIYYVAQPGGAPPVAFRLIQLTGQQAVFSNPRHDHPKLIRYRREPSGALVAEVEGDERGKHVVERFELRPEPSSR